MEPLSLAPRVTGIGAVILALLAAVQEPSPSVSSRLDRERVSAGDDAPALGLPDLDGRTVDWKAYGDRPVLLLFHSTRAHYSRRGLTDLLAAFAREDDPLRAVPLVVVVDADADLEVLARELDEALPERRIVVDRDRAATRAFGVVAYPTAFAIGPDSKVVEVVRGYGPLFGRRVHAAVERAAGAPEEARSRAGRSSAVSSEARRALAPALGLARAHVAAGRPEAARAVLREALAGEHETPEAVSLLARLLLFPGGDTQEAATWIERYAVSAPEPTRLDLLRARLALARGDHGRAEALLAELDPSRADVRLLRGELLLARGRCEEAAELLREALTTAVLAGEARRGR